jgi:nucleotide-binding universal stress UspA family protein
MAPTRIEIERVLCPTDFSYLSTRALDHAAAIGRWFEARVEVLHVIPFVIPAGTGDMPYFPAPAAATPKVRESELRELQQFVSAAVRAGAAVETELREGSPAREIVRWAEERSADLLVMGTHGRSGLERLLLGSVAEEVLRHAPCPVLTVCHGEAPAGPALFRRIICATDLSEASAHTIGVALSLAEENQAALTLVHVLEGLVAASYVAPVPLGVPHEGSQREGLERDALTRLRAAAPDEARTWCQVTEKVRAGCAHQQILRLAAEKKADLIVVGTHGRGPLEQMFFGSTSRHVVRGAACPVLSVPAAKPAGASGREAAVLTASS